MTTTRPGKQRKMNFKAPAHKRQKRMAAHLSESLLLKYKKRSVPIRRGDTVAILRGAFKGQSGRVSDIDTKKYRIGVEGATIAKADGTKIPLKIHPSNTVITKLDLSDPKRKAKIEGGK